MLTKPRDIIVYHLLVFVTYHQLFISFQSGIKFILYNYSFTMVHKYKFRGLMSPVFTSFSRTTGDVDLESIYEYAQFLHERGVNGILVNGTTGEGVCMTVSERKLVAEVWVKASKKTGQTIMVQVGGTCLKHVIELAKHAETIGASAILCLPELFHRPNNVDQLVSYLQEVGKAAPNTPLLYYHIPSFTGINLDMHEFLKAGAKTIPTLAGIKFTHTNLEEGAHCLKVENGDFGVFLGNDQIMAAAFLLGFDSLIATTLNMMPEEIIKIQKDVKEGKNSEALATQQKLVKIIIAITKYGAWVPSMKVAMQLMTGFDFGEPRKPQTALTKEQVEALRQDLAALNVLKE